MNHRRAISALVVLGIASYLGDYCHAAPAPFPKRGVPSDKNLPMYTSICIKGDVECVGKQGGAECADPEPATFGTCIWDYEHWVVTDENSRPIKVEASCKCEVSKKEITTEVDTSHVSDVADQAGTGISAIDGVSTEDEVLLHDAFESGDKSALNSVDDPQAVPDWEILILQFLLDSE